jgi:hypothetical protein
MEILKGLGTPVLGVLVNGVGQASATRTRLRTGADFRTVDRMTGEIRPEPKLSFASNGTGGLSSRSANGNHVQPPKNAKEDEAR